MKLLKISSYYPGFVSDFEKQCASKSYKAAMREIFDLSFAWSDYFETAMKTQGYEVWELIHNSDLLQRLWAQDNGIKATGHELLFKQIEFFKPEIVFLDTTDLPLCFVSEIKNRFKYVKTIGMFNCSPIGSKTLETMKAVDFVITCHRGLRDEYKSLGINVFHIYHAFGEAVLNRITKVQNKKNHILFSGSLIAGENFHDSRLVYLEKMLSSRLPVELHAFLQEEPTSRYWAKQAIYQLSEISKKLPIDLVSGFSWTKKVRAWKEAPKKIKLSQEIKKINKKPLFGLEMYQAMAESSVVFNIHGGIAGKYASNMRLFEATGIGSCLITDTKEDLGQLFKLDSEVLTYKNVEECIEKLEWAYQHPEKALEIGIQGQKRVLNEHTFEKRAPEFHSVFRAALSR